MIDLVILALLGLLLVRGWARGFVREGMDLLGLLVGTVLAFRIGPSVGLVVTAMANTSDEAARLIGGFIVFFVVGIGAAYLTRVIERRARMPGLNLVNRASGAGLAVAWGAFLATLVLTMAVVLPMPPAVANSIDESAFARTLTDPDGLGFRRTFTVDPSGRDTALFLQAHKCPHAGSVEEAARPYQMDPE